MYVPDSSLKEFLIDWKICCTFSDECSSGILKKVMKFLLGKHRNYGCICLQHDFDYNFGWKYGVSRKEADKELRLGVIASGNWINAWAMWSAVRLMGWRYYKDGSC